MRVQLSLLLILVVSAMALDAKTRRSTSRSGAHGKTVSASAKKTPGKNVAAKRTKAKGKRVAQARRAPRQSAPTQERYMEIQQALADKGFYTGEVNGAWGPESVQALKRFQAAQNLSVDGKLGALSLIALGLGPKRESIAQFAGKPESIR